MIELHLGLDDERAPQIRFELQQFLGTVRLVAVHTGDPTKSQTIARIEAARDNDEQFTFELIPVYAPLLCRAFGMQIGERIPVKLHSRDHVTFVTQEKPSGGHVGYVLGGNQGLPPDVRQLVIAARVVWESAWNVDAGELRALDIALEAFADRVPWNDEPEGKVYPTAAEAVDAALDEAFPLQGFTATSSTNCILDMRGQIGKPQAEDDGFITPEAALHNSGVIDLDIAQFGKPLHVPPSAADLDMRDHMASRLKPSAFSLTTADPLFDPDGIVKINGIPFVRVGCAKCGGPVVTNLDGDDLCQEHANEWVRGERRQ